MAEEVTTRDGSAHHGHSGWRPLLSGDLREEALVVVNEIAAALPAPGGLRTPGLAGGEAGLALFYGYLSEWREGDDDAATSAAHLNNAIRAAGARRLSPGLYGGLTGIAWASQHLRSRLTPDAEIRHETLDESLIAYVSRTPWGGDYDLISGLVGLGVYAVERLPRPAARTLLERVVERLEETAERTEAGDTWHTPAERLPDWQRENAPNGYYNLGLAHGVPGVIALLGLACRAGYPPRVLCRGQERRDGGTGATPGGMVAKKARPLLDAAVRWLLAQRLPAGTGGSFDSWIVPGEESGPARCAWCYGDPGVAAALLLAAAGVPDAWWHGEAVAVALGAAARAPEQSGVRDAGLCHGAAGLAHLYNRMFQATGEARLGEAARFWFRYTLDLRRPGEGTAGFKPYQPPDSEEAGHPDDSVGLLVGAAGIGLALLTACTAVAPEWDHVLLSAIPPPVGSGL
jgi:lantibiotic modifying enzyme